MLAVFLRLGDFHYNEKRNGIRRGFVVVFALIFPRGLCDCRVINASGHFYVTSWHTGVIVEYAKQLLAQTVSHATTYLRDCLMLHQ
jgi:hypothetical protein